MIVTSTTIIQREKYHTSYSLYTSRTKEKRTEFYKKTAVANGKT